MYSATFLHSSFALGFQSSPVNKLQMFQMLFLGNDAVGFDMLPSGVVEIITLSTLVTAKKKAKTQNKETRENGDQQTMFYIHSSDMNFFFPP